MRERAPPFQVAHSGPYCLDLDRHAPKQTANSFDFPTEVFSAWIASVLHGTLPVLLRLSFAQQLTSGNNVSALSHVLVQPVQHFAIIILGGHTIPTIDVACPRINHQPRVD